MRGRSHASKLTLQRARYDRAIGHLPHFTMRADICDSNDEVAVARFRDALHRLGAMLDDKSWGLGVHLYRLRIGEEELSVFSDEWSFDIEGSDDLVQRVLREYEQTVAKPNTVQLTLSSEAGRHAL
jgi:phenylalanyl-tRNA synthetase beta subunit